MRAKCGAERIQLWFGEPVQVATSGRRSRQDAEGRGALQVGRVAEREEGPEVLDAWRTESVFRQDHTPQSHTNVVGRALKCAIS